MAVSMTIKRAEDVPAEAVEAEGAKGVQIRWLIHQPDGAPNFYMRQFTVAPGGHTPRHRHDWEHEVYILSGTAVVGTPDGVKTASPGDCIYVPPNEEHQFLNAGSAELKFLCLVPKT